MAPVSADTQKSMTPADARARLEEGNARFVGGQCESRDLLAEVRASGDGQFPFAAILSCVDSRVPAEIVFDQGIGDFFSARVAGNFVNDDLLGSLEFACKVAGAKLIVVLGHSRCGAIKGSCDAVELGNLTGLLRKLRPAVDGVGEPTDPAQRTSANADFVEAVGHANVRRCVAEIPAQSPVLKELCDAGDIEILGAYYDVTTGSVEFLDS